MSLIRPVSCTQRLKFELFHASLVDMEKFPLRMKDNDLLVTELFRDPCGDAITALSVYLTPRTCKLPFNSTQLLNFLMNDSINPLRNVGNFNYNARFLYFKILLDVKIAGEKQMC